MSFATKWIPNVNKLIVKQQSFVQGTKLEFKQK